MTVEEYIYQEFAGNQVLANRFLQCFLNVGIDGEQYECKAVTTWNGLESLPIDNASSFLIHAPPLPSSHALAKIVDYWLHPVSQVVYVKVWHG